LWRESATAALWPLERSRQHPQETREDRRWIKEVGPDFRRKEPALAQTAAHVGFEVHGGDSSGYAVDLLRRAALAVGLNAFAKLNPEYDPTINAWLESLHDTRPAA
jgi:hypothetical protein